MKVGTFLAGQKKVLQIEKASQVHQLFATGKGSGVAGLRNAVIRVWNNKGQIIPPMSLLDLAVLNGDEYPVQVGISSTSDEYNAVFTYEICDEGSLSKPIYVELDLTSVAVDVELDSIDVKGTTAVKMRNYNFMNVVSPMVLPKNSICIFKYSDVLSLQKNKDLMGVGEILTHSNCVVRSGALGDVHPIVKANGNMDDNAIYAIIASNYVMGASTILSGKVVIVTGEDEFLLSPVTAGCAVCYCQKSLTTIASQVRQAIIASGQINNVDSSEFASAVAAVGRVAEKEGIGTDKTQSVANKVVPLLPSVKVAKLAGVNNFNLASEKEEKKGLTKTL